MKINDNSANKKLYLDPVNDSLPYRINLSKMWQVENGTDSQQRIDLAEWTPGCFQGLTRLVRQFNSPTNVEANQRITLALANFPSGTTCHINNRLLGTIDAAVCRFEIASYLQAGNRIELELGCLQFDFSAAALTACLEIL